MRNREGLGDDGEFESLVNGHRPRDADSDNEEMRYDQTKQTSSSPLSHLISVLQLESVTTHGFTGLSILVN
jgi:hypothetical protein